MNKTDAKIIKGLVKEIEFKLARIKAIADSSAEDDGQNILQMDAKEFFGATQVPFSTDRVLKWLDSEDIKTVRQVTEFSWKNLARYRNMGTLSIRYIEKCLAQHGLRLKMD
jgi:DNA-directed RNA polymerase alpha subunit